MLWFLSIAAKRGHVVDRYSDDAEGFLEKNAAGALAMTRVILRPKIEFSGTAPPPAPEIAAMHEAAHHACYIANSVTTDITIE